MTGSAFRTIKACEQQWILVSFLVVPWEKVCVPGLLTGIFYASQTCFNCPGDAGFPVPENSDDVALTLIWGCLLMCPTSEPVHLIVHLKIRIHLYVSHTLWYSNASGFYDTTTSLEIAAIFIKGIIRNKLYHLSAIQRSLVFSHLGAPIWDFHSWVNKVLCKLLGQVHILPVSGKCFQQQKMTQS